MMASVAYDVIAVDLETNKIRVLAKNKSKRNAEAVATMAVLRIGFDKEFYLRVTAGLHKDGDEYRPIGERTD